MKLAAPARPPPPQIATLFDDDGIVVRFMNSGVEGNGIRSAADAAALLTKASGRALGSLTGQRAWPRVRGCGLLAAGCGSRGAGSPRGLLAAGCGSHGAGSPRTPKLFPPPLVHTQQNPAGGATR